MRNRKQTVAPVFGASSPKKLLLSGKLEMNSQKWREVELSRQTILDLVEAHLLAMKSMSRREIKQIDIPSLIGEDMIKIRIKMESIKK